MTAPHLLWTPAVAGAVDLVTGLTSAGYRLLMLDGIGPVKASPFTVKAPGQRGSTALDMVVPERVVSAQVLILGATLDDLFTKRAALSAAMGSEPVSPFSAASLALGTLVLTRGGTQANLQIGAVPADLAMVLDRASSSGVAAADLEWFCPDPFWQPTADTVVTIPTSATPVACANPGDGYAYPTFVISGAMTGPITVTDNTTGLAFKFSGNLTSGQTITVVTQPGLLSATLNPGATNYMASLDVSTGNLFPLAPGANAVQWVATAGGAGPRNVVVTYRPRYRGA